MNPNTLRKVFVLVLVLGMTVGHTAYAGGLTFSAPGGMPAKIYVQPSFSNPAFGIQFPGGSAAINRQGTTFNSSIFGNGQQTSWSTTLMPFRPTVPPPVQFRGSAPVWTLPIWRY